MVDLQRRASTVDAELARVARVTAKAWGLSSPVAPTPLQFRTGTRPKACAGPS